MLEKNAVNEAIDILSPDSFYVEAHRKIFGAIQELFRTDQPIDLLTVTNELKKRGELEVVGGPFHISQLTNKVASSANVQYHARIISQKHILRELIRISAGDQRVDAYDDTTDVFDLLDKTEQDLYAITSGNLKRNYEPMSDLIQGRHRQHREREEPTGGVSGVPTGSPAGQDHRRLAEERHDHRGRPPRHGQDGLRAQHGAQHRRGTQAGGGGLQPGDEQHPAGHRPIASEAGISSEAPEG